MGCHAGHAAHACGLFKKGLLFERVIRTRRPWISISGGGGHNKLAKILLNSKMKKLDPPLKSAQILSRILEVQEKRP
jgi:hypothetical protein